MHQDGEVRRETPPADAQAGTILFMDDDDGYLTWIAEHPDGYVVNAERRPRPAYLMLHRADCSTVTGVPARGAHWTKDYIKVCARQRQPLDAWAAAEAGGSLRHCRHCER